MRDRADEATRNERWVTAKQGAALLAVGVGLGAAVPAEGGIVHTVPGTPILLTGTFELDLNDDGIIDFILAVSPPVAGIQGIIPDNGIAFQPFYAGAEGKTSLPGAQALPAGTPIPDGLSFTNDAFLQYDGKAPWDILTVGDKRFLALRFLIGEGTHYGWIGIRIGSLILEDFAFEDVPDRPIAAGDTGQARVPEPSSILLLAAGAAAVLAFRRQRRERDEAP